MQSLLFSFQGRVNRAKFWLVHVVMWVVMMIAFGAILGSAAVSSDPQAALQSVRVQSAYWTPGMREKWRTFRVITVKFRLMAVAAMRRS